MFDYHFQFVLLYEPDLISDVADRLDVPQNMTHRQDFEDAVYALLCDLAESLDKNGGKPLNDWFVPFFRSQSTDEAKNMTKWSVAAGLTNNAVGSPKAVADTLAPLTNAVEAVFMDAIILASETADEARGPIWTERADND